VAPPLHAISDRKANEATKGARGTNIESLFRERLAGGNRPLYRAPYHGPACGRHDRQADVMVQGEK
jgi:hypothetical protein